jgi:cytochrome P450
VLRDPHAGRDPTRLFEPLGLSGWWEHEALRSFFGSLLFRNPPEHTRLRRLVSGVFTARRVQELRPAVECLVQQLLDRMEDAGANGAPVEFMDAFAFPLPVTVIGELLGVPAADRVQFRSLVRQWTTVVEEFRLDELAQANAAAHAIRDYFTGLVRQRRTHPGEDLLSALVAVADRGDRLTEDELLTMIMFLFAAGFETTTNLLGNGLRALLDAPDQLARLRADPLLAASAVEELLRYDTPVQLTGRMINDDVRLGDGLRLRAGEGAELLLGAANRDPARFHDPHRLDISRREAPPLSFGGGVHYCLGAALARLEGQVAFPAVLQRFPSIAPAGEPVRRPGLTLRGFAYLPLAVR